MNGTPASRLVSSFSGSVPSLASFASSLFTTPLSAGFSSLVGLADEDPAVVTEFLGDRCRCLVAAALLKLPGDRTRAHRRAKQVSRTDYTTQRIASDGRSTGKAHVDAKIRTLVRRDQEAAVHRLVVDGIELFVRPRRLPPRHRRARLRTIALEQSADAVVSERIHHPAASSSIRRCSSC